MKLSRRARRVIPLTILLVVCLCLLTLVVRQVALAWLEMNNARRVQAGEAIGVRPWMTIPYIAATYGVPEARLYAAIGVEANRQNAHAPIQLIARREGHNVDDDIAKLNAVIDRSHLPTRRRWPPRPFSPPTPATPQAAP